MLIFLMEFLYTAFLQRACPGFKEFVYFLEDLIINPWGVFSSFFSQQWFI